MTDLDQKVRELRALAEKATPGPWGAWIKSRTIQVDARGGDGKLPAIINWPGFDGNDMGQKANNANAAYIAAANPATLTAILDEYDRRGAALVDIRDTPYAGPDWPREKARAALSQEAGK